MNPGTKQIQESKSDSFRPILIDGSESAADAAMSTFFELAAAEKSRMKEISIRHFPGHRSSRIAFSERFGWAKASETLLCSAEMNGERSVNDGNRDIRSRLATHPCNPQFRNHIPRYLDHSADSKEMYRSSASNFDKGVETRETNIDALTKILLEAGNLTIVDMTKQTATDDEPDIDIPADHKSSVDADNDYISCLH
jgi:hypothetical protein